MTLNTFEMNSAVTKAKHQIKKVAIYSRKSRDDETEEALKKQLHHLIEICNQNNWEYDVYKEVGSSQDNKRPEYNKMVSRLQKYDYDAVLVTDQDRLTRSQGALKKFKLSYKSITYY